MTSDDFEHKPERRLEQRFGETNYNLFIRWQALRRDSEYRDFCDKYKQFFDDDHILRWELLLTEDAEKEADQIKETYGLDYIYHHNTDLDLGRFIDSCVFLAPFAVNYLLKEKKLEYKTIPDEIDDMFDPFWESNYIHLRVNVGEGITEAQLKEEFLEKVKEARELAGIKRRKSMPNELDFKVYDLSTYEEKGFKEIFKEVWPEDFEKAFAGLTNADRDRLYKRLQKKYRNKGIENWHEKAWKNAYGGDSHQNQRVEDLDATSGNNCVSPKQLYDRVAKSIKRVEQHIKQTKLHT